MARGRYSTYTPKYIKKVDEYLATCVQTVEDYTKTDGDKSTSYQRIIHANIPKVEGFARYLDVHKDTLYAWAKENDDFSDALSKIVVEQHNRLIEGGLNGDYSPVITKLMLSSIHGYREKSDLTSDGGALTVNVVSFKNDNSDDTTQLPQAD